MLAFLKKTKDENRVETNVKTVSSVYATFTAELEQVTTQHQALADNAKATQEVLERKRELLAQKVDTQKSRQAAAESEVSQATMAMKNIGEMLGIKSQ
jgi:hypothetical protein